MRMNGGRPPTRDSLLAKRRQVVPDQDHAGGRWSKCEGMFDTIIIEVMSAQELARSPPPATRRWPVFDSRLRYTSLNSRPPLISGSVVRDLLPMLLPGFDRGSCGLVGGISPPFWVGLALIAVTPDHGPLRCSGPGTALHRPPRSPPIRGDFEPCRTGHRLRVFAILPWVQIQPPARFGGNPDHAI